MLRLGTSTEDDHLTPPPVTAPSPQTETTTHVPADPSEQAVIDPEISFSKVTRWSVESLFSKTSPTGSHPVSGDRGVLEVGAKGLRQSSSGPSAEEDHRRRGRSERAVRDDQGRHGAGWAAAGESGGEEECGRERLKRHRVAMAGRVWIPETWGQESLLKDWVDCAAVDGALVPGGLVSSAREALVEECRRAEPGSGFRIESTCFST